EHIGAVARGERVVTRATAQGGGDRRELAAVEQRPACQAIVPVATVGDHAADTATGVGDIRGDRGAPGDARDRILVAPRTKVAHDADRVGAPLLAGDDVATRGR